MASELRLGAIRMGANYVRLAFKLLIGIAIVPIMLLGVGIDAFGLIAMLGSTMGIAEMCRAIVAASMKRELGSRYHSSDPEDFPDAFNSALLLSAALAVVTIALFAALYLLLDLLTIPEELLAAAQWVVIAKGIYSVLFVLLGPMYNMYQISERMVLYNTWMILDRATDFGAAIVLFVMLGMRDPEQGVIVYAWLSSGTGILVLLVAVALIMFLDRRLIPNPSRIRIREIHLMLPTMGWNTAVITASNLHIRLAQFIMNIFFGLPGNSMFGIAVRLTSYVRIAAHGSTDGVEVVSTRLSSKQQRMTVPELLAYTTRLQTAIAVPAALVVLILSGPIIQAWVGWISRVAHEPEVIAGAIVLSKVLVLGMVVRGIGDAWKRILYGAGHVRAYGPVVILGGALNPAIAIALIYFLPDSTSYQGPAWAFGIAGVLVNFVWIPKIAARCLDLSLRDILMPIVRPALAALLASIVLWAPFVLEREDSLTLLLTTLAVFGTIHGLLCWFYVLSPPERERLTAVVARRIGMGRHIAAGTS